MFGVLGRRVLAAATALTLLTGAGSASALEMLLQVDGVQGEAKSAQLPNAIEVQSFSLASKGGASGAGGATGTFHGLHVTKAVDKSSPALMLASLQGQHFPTVTLNVIKGGQNGPYYRVKLIDATVSAVAQSATATGSSAGETVTFEFAKIQIEYRVANPDGSLGAPVKMGFDVKAGVKI